MTRKETRSYADRAPYLRQAVARRRKELRQKALEYGGSACNLCGYAKSTRALSFHHRDPQQKDFALSAKGLTRSWDKIEAELKKCILLCANCHAEVHDGTTQLPGENPGRKTR